MPDLALLRAPKRTSLDECCRRCTDLPWAIRLRKIFAEEPIPPEGFIFSVFWRNTDELFSWSAKPKRRAGECHLVVREIGSDAMA
jgi:hypothetical protein